MIEFKIYGDAGLLINFEQKIDRSVNDEVVSLSNAIERATVPGVVYLVPAYCSITVGYDPSQINYDLLVEIIKAVYQQKKAIKNNKHERKMLIPVCYEPPHTFDFDELERQLEITRQEIIKLHTSSLFHVYMLGFLPGFAYMGALPEKLICARKQAPRIKVPARSVGLAGEQTGIYPIDAPGGWQIIGRTPIPIFDPKNESPFLFEAGDTVQFYAISDSNFEKIEKDVDTGNFNFKELYG